MIRLQLLYNFYTILTAIFFLESIIGYVGLMYIKTNSIISLRKNY
jgi:hypothetical protein